MAKQTQFEVLTLKNGEWQTDTIPIEEAMKKPETYGQGHLEGVKVIRKFMTIKQGRRRTDHLRHHKKITKTKE